MIVNLSYAVYFRIAVTNHDYIRRFVYFVYRESASMLRQLYPRGISSYIIFVFVLSLFPLGKLWGTT
jgi:hypothetical protein